MIPWIPRIRSHCWGSNSRALGGGTPLSDSLHSKESPTGIKSISFSRVEIQTSSAGRCNQPGVPSFYDQSPHGSGNNHWSQKSSDVPCHHWVHITMYLYVFAACNILARIEPIGEGGNVNTLISWSTSECRYRTHIPLHYPSSSPGWGRFWDCILRWPNISEHFRWTNSWRWSTGIT